MVVSIDDYFSNALAHKKELLDSRGAVMLVGCDPNGGIIVNMFSNEEELLSQVDRVNYVFDGREYHVYFGSRQVVRMCNRASLQAVAAEEYFMWLIGRGVSKEELVETLVRNGLPESKLRSFIGNLKTQ